MAGFSIIADTSEKLVKKFQNNMIPDLIQNQNSITLCSPSEKEDSLLGIYLYQISESEEIRRIGMINIGEDMRTNPPMFLNLYYMITAYSHSDIKFRMMEEQKIIGRVLQTIHDSPIITKEELYKDRTFGLDAKIQILKIDSDEKNKIWDFKDSSYKLSVFIKVTPIILESAYTERFTRVKEADFHVDEK